MHCGNEHAFRKGMQEALLAPSVRSTVTEVGRASSGRRLLNLLFLDVFICLCHPPWWNNSRGPPWRLLRTCRLRDEEPALQPLALLRPRFRSRRYCRRWCRWWRRIDAHPRANVSLSCRSKFKCSTAYYTLDALTIYSIC